MTRKWNPFNPHGYKTEAEEQADRAIYRALMAGDELYNNLKRAMADEREVKVLYFDVRRTRPPVGER